MSMASALRASTSLTISHGRCLGRKQFGTCAKGQEGKAGDRVEFDASSKHTRRHWNILRQRQQGDV